MAHKNARLAALALILAIAPACSAQTAAPDPRTARMLELVNAARAESALPALVSEPRLADAACRHARDLARGGPLTHRGSEGSDVGDRLRRSGYDFAMGAENLAAGVATPDETVWLWLGSPGHRRNILTAEFREAGIARVSGAGGEIWVLVLAAPRAATPSPKPDEQRADVEGDNRLTCY